MHLDERIAGAKHLNIRYTQGKGELIHLIPFTSGRRIKNANKTGINIYGIRIAPTDKIKVLGVHIDNRLSFKSQAAAASAGTRRSTEMLYRITQGKGASPAIIHHLIKTVTMPAMLSVQKFAGTGPETCSFDLPPPTSNWRGQSQDSRDGHKSSFC